MRIYRYQEIRFSNHITMNAILLLLLFIALSFAGASDQCKKVVADVK
jgi:hypothetical protein